MATVLIGADLYPIGANREYFEQDNAEALFSDLLSEIIAADLVIANLECPFIRKPSPIRKTGPVFGVNPNCIEAVRAAGIRVLCLATNHILDHGADGLRSTLEVCHRARFATVEAGRDVHEASQPLFMDLKGLKMALLAVVEHELSVAGPSSPGANPPKLDYARPDRSRASREPGPLVCVVPRGGGVLTGDTAGAAFMLFPHGSGGYRRRCAAPTYPWRVGTILPRVHRLWAGRTGHGRGDLP